MKMKELTPVSRRKPTPVEAAACKYFRQKQLQCKHPDRTISHCTDTLCPKIIHSIYFAAPFFNLEEETFVDQTVVRLRNIGFKVFSPKEEGGIIGKTVPKEAAQKIFDDNIKAIQVCGMIIATIDDFDPGTIWEIGYAFALNKPIITVSRKGYGLNIMLAKSTQAHFLGSSDLIWNLEKYWETGIVPKQVWEGDVQ